MALFERDLSTRARNTYESSRARFSLKLLEIVSRAEISMTPEADRLAQQRATITRATADALARLEAKGFPGVQRVTTEFRWLQSGDEFKGLPAWKLYEPGDDSSDIEFPKAHLLPDGRLVVQSPREAWMDEHWMPNLRAIEPADLAGTTGYDKVLEAITALAQ